jgi:Tol biopolymer transport system component
LLNAVLVALVIVATAVAVRGWTRAAPLQSVSRLEVTMAGNTRIAYPIRGVNTGVAISPDGQFAVLDVERGTGFVLAIRSLDHLTPRVLAGTDGAIYAEVSPDGKWIAFEAPDGMLKKIAVDGTNLSTLCQIGPLGSGGITWISDREIVFAPRTFTSPGMLRCSATGGAPVTFAHIDTINGERYQVGPRSAADGRLVFYASPSVSATDMTLGVARTRDGLVKRFPSVHLSHVLGLIDDLLVYVQVDGKLMAVSFDEGALTIGTPVQVGDSIAVRDFDAAAALAANGSLLYQQGGSVGQLVRVDLQGRASVLIDSARAYAHPRFSPDGKRLAFEITTPAGSDIWTTDLVSHALERLTNGGINDRPEWSPDGRRVVYASSRDTPGSIWSQPADASGEATRVFAATEQIREVVFTPDGQTVVYRVDARKTNRDIWMVSLTGDRTPVPLLTSPHDEKEPRVSPDGKWLAYVSDESGREEVYLRPLAPSGGRVPVSAGGGGEPLWSPDGRRLYYRAADALMEAAITISPTLSVGERRTVFTGPYAGDFYHPNYDVAPDGKSFVMVRPSGESRRIVIVVNWITELRRRLGRSN